MSSYCHEMGFYPQDARLEQLDSTFFLRFFQQFSDCARVTLAIPKLPNSQSRRIRRTQMNGEIRVATCTGSGYPSNWRVTVLVLNVLSELQGWTRGKAVLSRQFADKALRTMRSCQPQG